MSLFPATKVSEEAEEEAEEEVEEEAEVEAEEAEVEVEVEAEVSHEMGDDELDKYLSRPRTVWEPGFLRSVLGLDNKDEDEDNTEPEPAGLMADELQWSLREKSDDILGKIGQTSTEDLQHQFEEVWHRTGGGKRPFWVEPTPPTTKGDGLTGRERRQAKRQTKRKGERKGKGQGKGT